MFIEMVGRNVHMDDVPVRQRMRSHNSGGPSPESGAGTHSRVGRRTKQQRRKRMSKMQKEKEKGKETCHILMNMGLSIEDLSVAF